MTRLIIRNMVCDRCKAAITRLLEAQVLSPTRVDLGEVHLTRAASVEQLDGLQTALREQGFDLVLDHDAQVITKVKAEVVRRVHHEGGGRVDLSALVREAVHRELSSVSKLFSEVEGITLEHYFLLQRLERVKEMIRYGELSFSEIAFATGFSSAAHLSSQFKQLTGMTPTAFKATHGKRSPLDQVG